jgi:hypothetical protein
VSPVPYKLYLRPEQHDWLREQALTQRTTASALARLAVDLLQAQVTSGTVRLSAELDRRGEET